MYDLQILAPTTEVEAITPISGTRSSPLPRRTRILPYRSLIVWFTAAVTILLLFSLFVRYGWPGSPDPCTTAEPTNTCWCEAFEPSDIGTPGVRQSVNTWSNLYALFTSLLVATVVCLDRQETRNSPQSAGSKSLIRGSDTWVADLYVFVVLYLGLGSMWFHASLTTWGGILDALSIYALMAFLVVFSLQRSFNQTPALFWIAYWLLVAALTIVHALAQPRYEETTMFLVIASLIAYSLLELHMWRKGKTRSGSSSSRFWWCACASGLVAAVFWGLSQTGQLLCVPSSHVQPHGIIWHPLAGVSAVLLFFYWRAAETGTLESGLDS
ncbi:hypothetical protein E2P81_ATG07550 [Venturia nashicola]|uniref:Ceramidase n=1 Tax=Venturia nashicola TaxID=86259 RepID=A0A4Z1NYJ2_9PEZI|nr:hypothetical protein E6O75_ATG07709 [Venturia nashicola]TLD32060.1 hypothetical protein E2P81_ATG07550 [Venturia nashicola]